MIQGGMLDDGQTQTRSTARFRTALVNAIETLKYLTLLLGRNTNTRIGNRQMGARRRRFRTATSPYRRAGCSEWRCSPGYR